MAEISSPEREAHHWGRYQNSAIWLAVGMPVVRKMEPGLWKVRSKLVDRIARIQFTIKDGKMVLLHGFILHTPNAKTAQAIEDAIAGRDLHHAKDAEDLFTKLKA
jgi:phage-related protein